MLLTEWYVRRNPRGPPVARSISRQAVDTLARPLGLRTGERRHHKKLDSCFVSIFSPLARHLYLRGRRRPIVIQDVPRPLQAPQETAPEIFASHCVDAF